MRKGGTETGHVWRRGDRELACREEEFIVGFAELVSASVKEGGLEATTEA